MMMKIKTTMMNMNSAMTVVMKLRANMMMPMTGASLNLLDCLVT